MGPAAAPAEPAPAEPAPAEPAPAEPAPAEPAPAEPAPAEPAGEYGEVYEADPAILESMRSSTRVFCPPTRCRRTSLWPPTGVPTRRFILSTTTSPSSAGRTTAATPAQGGELTVGYVEGFGENIYREISKMEFILQALTYPEIGEIIYTSAQSNPDQALTDFRAAISQGVDVIVTYPDFGDAMLPVFQEATAAGIPVATYAWGYVTGPGENYLTVVGEDTCELGEAYAEVMNTEVGLRRDRLPRRLPR